MDMPSMYTEADYEKCVIELFQNMGYQYVYGPDVERDYKSPLYDDVLVESLTRLNPKLPDAAIQEALYKLKNFENGTLVQKNIVFMNYLQNGIEVSYHHKAFCFLIFYGCGVVLDPAEWTCYIMRNGRNFKYVL